MAPPEEWGPPAWVFIFTIIDEMPEFPSQGTEEYYRMFFESLSGVLPCKECRDHYSSYIESNPVPTWSREQTRAWAQELRNRIRKRKRKNKFLGLF